MVPWGSMHAAGAGRLLQLPQRPVVKDADEELLVLPLLPSFWLLAGAPARQAPSSATTRSELAVCGGGEMWLDQSQATKWF